MMDFSTLQGLTIPEGVVTQIADVAGVVLWAAASDKVILEVEKITSDTYAGETTYTGEEFILLDIYPKTNGTVNVTYGGLTKTITDTSGAAQPNSQKVFFGTFNGVSDSVETPASGTLMIEGDYEAFAAGAYSKQKMDVSGSAYTGILTIVSTGSASYIPLQAFGGIAKNPCVSLKRVNLGINIKTIESFAFEGCSGLTSITIPNSVTIIGVNPWARCFDNNGITVASGNTAYKIDGNCLIEISTNRLVSGYSDAVIPSYVTSIGGHAFEGCSGLTSINIPDGVTIIEYSAFYNCSSLTSVTIPQNVTNIGNDAFAKCQNLTSVILLSATPPTIDDSSVFAYEGVDSTPQFKVQFTIPKGSLEAYLAVQAWNDLADYITEAS